MEERVTGASGIEEGVTQHFKYCCAVIQIKVEKGIGLTTNVVDYVDRERQSPHLTSR